MGGSFLSRAYTLDRRDSLLYRKIMITRMSTSTTCHFLSFPIELIPEIQVYLCGIDSAYFVSTSKVLFQEIKKKTIQLILRSYDDNERFLTNEEFRLRIYNLIHNPEQQLELASLVVDKPLKNLLNFPFKSLVLDNCEHLDKITGWKKILSHRTSLNLTSNYKIKKFDNMEKLQKMILSSFGKLNDVSNLAHLQELFLDQCDSITNVSMLSNVKKLSIRDCDKIIDISALGNIPFLSLFGNKAISIIPTEFHTISLTIQNCPLITNAASLKYVKYLDTDMIHSYDDSLHLQSVIRINLFKYNDSKIFIPNTLKRIKLSLSFIEDISNFTSLSQVFVNDCPKLLDLTALGEVPVVTLSAMKHIKDISALNKSPRCQSVTINWCGLVTDFSPLNHLPFAVITMCNGFRNLQDVADVKNLKVSHCANFANI